MKITWFGHASFLLTNAAGKKILMDPFDKSVGYDVYEGEADLITISHHHHDHDYVDDVKGSPIVIDKLGSYSEYGIIFKGIPSFHDKNKGANRGENTIFVFDVDGYRICHLGDLGYELTKEEISEIGKIDVLMIPVGGYYTIDAAEAGRIAKSINSHYVIPMHFKTPDAKAPIAGVEPFITEMGNAEYEGSNVLELSGKLEGYNQVKILEYI